MPAPTEATKPKRTKHAAPGQYLGYALQPVRLCFHLLTCPPSASVSLEHLDDVTVHYPDGSILLEQTKSALSQNPLGDFANDFWKCLTNWFTSVSSGTIDPKVTTFRLYVTPVKSGPRATALSQATSQKDIEKIFSRLKTSLSKLKKQPSCLAHINAVLGLTPEDRFNVVSRFRVTSSDPDPVEPIRELLMATVGPALIDPLCQFAIGRAKELADALIREGKPAIIDGDQFKADFRLFVQKNNLPSFLTPLTTTPSELDVSSLLSTHPVFIQQLDLVKVDEDDRVRAVSDFLRAAADKTSWSEAGVIFDSGLKDWDNDLVRRHQFIRGEVSDVHAEKDPVTKGRIIYRRSSQMEPSLEGRAVPGHFVHGCLNALADKKSIGWHPEFATLLKEKNG